MTPLQNTGEPLIKVSVRESNYIQELVVDGRELYRLLSVQEPPYLDWIRELATEYGYDKGYDFTIIEDPQPCAELDHHLTVEMAKSIALNAVNVKIGRVINTYLTDYEEKYYKIERDCRAIFNSPTPVKAVAMIRTWHWVVQIMCRDDLQHLFPYQPNPFALQAPLLFELLESIKANFSTPTSEYDVNQFIEAWRPSAFSNVPDQI